MDTINSPIKYSFVSGTPNSYADYFRIDQEKGTIHQIKAVDTSTTKTFNIIIKVLFTTKLIELMERTKQCLRLKKFRKQNVPQLPS